MLNRLELSALIPHAGAMCLLDSVLSWDQATIHCRAISHRDPANPLAVAGRLDVLCLIEYGAQAMAVHGGLIVRQLGQTAPPGLLVSVRDVRFRVSRIDDIATALDVHAQRLVASVGSWLYAFQISAGGIELASGRVAVIARD